MYSYGVLSEGELFCTDLQYKTQDEKLIHKYAGEWIKNNEDAQ